MPVTVLDTTYGPELYRNRDPEDGWISADIQNSPIESAAFYYSKKKDKQGQSKETIHQILFFFDPKYPSGLIEKLLISTYGQPTVIAKKKHFAWNVNADANIFYTQGEDTYVVSAKGVYPGSWPAAE